VDNAPDFSSLVDLENCTVSPIAFSSEAVYQAELEKIFSRSWLYLGHTSQIAKANDYLTTFMGAEPVIIVRQSSGEIKAFLNSCRHRGMRLCRRDHGNKKLFSCPYHGWTYDEKGDLKGVPQLDTAYHNELDRSAWGLIPVSRVETFEGMIFGNFDMDAVSLVEYLGDMAWYLELVLKRSKAGMEAFPGCHRWRLGGNWKLPAEQFGGDNYHTGALHRSMSEIGLGPKGDYRGDNPWVRDFEVKCINGHGWINFDVGEDEVPPEQARFFAQLREEAKETLTPKQADLVLCAQVGTVFPNMSIISFFGFTSIRVWHPLSAKEMLVHSYGLVEKNAPQSVRELTRKAMGLTFSPSGIFEQDDGVAWGDIARFQGGPIRSKHPFNYQMGKGHGKRMEDKPGLIGTCSTEIGVFGLYEKWQELMSQ